MKFTKLTASGNDFILFDNRTAFFSGNETRFFSRICQRRHAVGADGVILLEKSADSDFRYRHFNSDGSPAAMCGNGARAACYYAVSKKIALPHTVFDIHGVRHEGWVSGTSVKLKLPPPAPARMPLGIVSESYLEEGGFIEVGVPHLVLFVKNTEKVNVAEAGRRHSGHPCFAHGTNVDFVQMLDAASLRVRTYERGVEDETLSCGTGAVASAVIAHLLKAAPPPIAVQTKGGDLSVDWKNLENAIFLTGSACIIYEAQLMLRPD